MAEIRTHDPEAGSEIRKLVLEALGEDIRPTQPGSQPKPTSEDTIDEAGPSIASSLGGTTISFTDF